MGSWSAPRHARVHGRGADCGLARRVRLGGKGMSWQRVKAAAPNSRARRAAGLSAWTRTVPDRGEARFEIGARRGVERLTGSADRCVAVGQDGSRRVVTGGMPSAACATRSAAFSRASSGPTSGTRAARIAAAPGRALADGSLPAGPARALCMLFAFRGSSSLAGERSLQAVGNAGKGFAIAMTGRAAYTGRHLAQDRGRPNPNVAAPPAPSGVHQIVRCA